MSSSEGCSATDGTASSTVTSKNGRSRNRNPPPPRDPTRFRKTAKDRRVAWSTALYVKRA